MRSLALKLSVTLLATALALGGAGLLRRTTVAAADLSVTGKLSMQPEGYITIDDGDTEYSVVSGMYLAAYFGNEVTLAGGIDDGILYVAELTFGSIHVLDQGGRSSITATGTVEEGQGGFQVVAEGIAFTVVGSTELNTVVGVTADIEGELSGATIDLTSLTTIDGRKIKIDGTDQGEEVPQEEQGQTETSGWGYGDWDD